MPGNGLCDGRLFGHAKNPRHDGLLTGPTTKNEFEKMVVTFGVISHQAPSGESFCCCFAVCLRDVQANSESLQGAGRSAEYALTPPPVRIKVHQLLAHFYHIYISKIPLPEASVHFNISFNGHEDVKIFDLACVVPV